MNKLLLFITFWSISYSISAQVLINEVSAANTSGIVSANGDREDWVELLNTGFGSVNISGWFLSDDPANPKKWTVPSGIVLAPGAYRVIFCSGVNQTLTGGQLHTNFKITQTKGESVVLTRADETQADLFTFNVPNQNNHSYGRQPNGGATWKIHTTPTPGAANSGASYQSYAPKVKADMDPGFYTGSVTVALTTDPGFDIRYTTNGSEPTGVSPLYSGPVLITATQVLKARAFSSNTQILAGFVLANTYFINVNHSIPVVSLAGDNVQALFNGSTSLRPVGSFEYFEDGEEEAEAYGEMNKHGNDSWAYQQRGIDWITRDQLGYKDELKHQFFPERDRTKFQRLILKAAANDNYPFEPGAHIRDAYIHMMSLKGGMNMDVRANRSCILYLNGQYWGVYEIREKADDSDYTKHYYDQDENDLDYIKTWGNTWADYGSINDWVSLRGYILGNNMALPVHYNYVQQRLDMLSLVDYIIINQHTVCKDWLQWNTAWWHGRNPNGGATKWRYALWDMDATFGHYINYTNIINTGPTANPCEVEQIAPNNDPEAHIDILISLFQNPDFKSLYINRYAELLNGPLSCANMIALLNEMVNEIAPEMPAQCARWGGTVNNWQQEVQQIRDFINARCQVLDNAIVNCYEVTGPFPLTVQVSPASSANQVMVNNITPAVYPYSGDFFGEVTINLVAQPAPGWIFDHWEVSGNTFGPNATADTITLDFNNAGTVTAFFIPIAPCTAPDALAFNNVVSAAAIDWTGPLSASSYRIQYRKTGDVTWKEINTPLLKWTIDTLPGCTNYEMQIQTVCPAETSAFVPFSFTTPDRLSGFDLPDLAPCNQFSVVLDATVTGATTYLWDNNSAAPTRTVTAPGQYWVRVESGNCVVTDTLEFAPVNTVETIQPVLCAGETLVIEGETFDVTRPNGQIILANAATNACDSIINVNLSFLPLIQTNLNKQDCDPAMVGIDTVTLSNFAGCDSLVITTTTLAPTSQLLLNATSCNPALIGVDTLILSNFLGCDSLVITTTAFDPTAITTTALFVQNCDPAMVGVDTVILTNFAGCDSLVITTTTLAPTSQTLLNATSCNPALIGVDTLILSNFLGCDSLVITTTAFDPAAITTTALFVQNCDPALVGVDTVILTNFAGCDSLVVTTTTLAPTSQILLNATSCNPALIGVDTLVLSNFLGCDSLVITTTAFDPAAITTTALFVKNCDPALVGIDTVILTNFAGCDSLVITTTTLAPTSQILLNATSCNPALIGVDTLILSNFLGCDSLVITTTAFDPAAITTTALFVQNCDPALVGIDTVILTNFAGCDSLVVTTTTLAPTSQTLLNATSCNPSLVGVDTLVLNNIWGCDSLVITTTIFDPSAITTTTLFVKNCDPALVGTDTVIITNNAGCNALIVTVTELAPTSQTFRTATACDVAQVGVDTLTLSNQYGCDSLVITNTLYAGIDIAASTEGTRCFGERNGIIRLDSAFTAYLPVQLALDNNINQIYDGTPLTWSNLSAGVYELVATNAEGCTDTRVIEVPEAPELLLSAGTEQFNIHLGDSSWVEISANFLPAQVQWLPLTDVSCPTCLSTYVSPVGTARYIVSARDSNDCAVNTSFIVVVASGIRLFVPNVMSLDAANAGNQWTIFAGPEVTLIRSARIFDRWGNKIFEQTNVSPNSPTNWDGSYKGRLLPPGVVIWMCEVDTVDGKTTVMQGDITIIR